MQSKRFSTGGSACCGSILYTTRGIRNWGINPRKIHSRYVVTQAFAKQAKKSGTAADVQQALFLLKIKSQSVDTAQIDGKVPFKVRILRINFVFRKKLFRFTLQSKQFRIADKYCGLFLCFLLPKKFPRFLQVAQGISYPFMKIAGISKIPFNATQLCFPLQRVLGH